MAKGSWFSLVITRKKLMLVGAVVVAAILILAGITMYNVIVRRVYGVKPGVKVAGHDVGGMLRAELYDTILKISTAAAVEARNASYDWQNDQISPEQIGQVIDINATIDQVMKASADSLLDLVTVPVLPSITQANFTPYYRGPADQPLVSLMINVDWGNEVIPAMLEVFKRYDVATTWFLTGTWAEKYPDLAAAIASAGHEIGNHGGWHGMASQMTREEIQDLILTGEDKIMDITGQKPMLFAPPAGDFNKQTVAVAAELGYKTILWTIDTVDWQRPAPTVIIDRVITRIQNGALVLMHPTEPTLQALPLIIEQLQKRGYTVVPVSQNFNH